VLADLLATDGVIEHCELRSKVGFMALHGGLEATTWEIAQEAAARSGASLYGVVQPPDLHWHVPSKAYELDASAALASFCDHVDIAISVHGYGGVVDHESRWLTVCVGGRGRTEGRVVADALRVHLPDYTVLDDLDEIPPNYRGVHPDNPVNRVRRGGVQIELPPRIRGTSPVWANHDFDREPWVPHTAALLDALTEAAQRLLGDPTPR